MPTLAVSPVHIKEVSNPPQLSTWKRNFSLWLRWSPGVVVQVLGLTLNEAGPPVLGQECIWAPEKGQKSWLLSGLRPSKEEIQYNCLKFSCKDDGIKLFLVVAGDTVRGQRARVAEWELHVGHWGNLFSWQVQDWNKLLVEEERREIFFPGSFQGSARNRSSPTWLFLNGHWHKPRYRVAQQSQNCVCLNRLKLHTRLGKLNMFYCKSAGPTQNFHCTSSPDCEGSISIKLPLMQLPWGRDLSLYLHKLFYP